MTSAPEGSAVYVFCILTGSKIDPDGNTDMLFTIDGEKVGTFVKQTNGDNQYTYNVPVYFNESLPHGHHTITLESGVLGKRALVLFDRVVYT